MPQSGHEHKHMQSKMCHRHEDYHSKEFCVVCFPITSIDFPAGQWKKTINFFNKNGKNQWFQKFILSVPLIFKLCNQIYFFLLCLKSIIMYHYVPLPWYIIEIAHIFPKPLIECTFKY